MSASPSLNTHECRVESLLLVHKDAIRRYIASRSGPMVLKLTTIDDLFQDTAREALGSAATFNFIDDGRFLGWATTIARRVISRTLFRNMGLPAVTRIKRAASSGDGIVQDGILGWERTPSSVAAGGEGREALRWAVANLCDDYREVIELYSLQELPLDQVASRMGRSKGAVCQLLARALREVRLQMGRGYGGHDPQ